MRVPQATLIASPAAVRRLARAQHAVDDVGDVGEVARLLAVAVDGRPAPGDERGRKQRDDAGVRRARILPRSEHVEVADDHRLEAVEPVEHLAVLGPHDFLQRVRRQRARPACLRAWAASGVLPYSDDEPANTSRFTPASRAATSTLRVASTLARLEVIGS